MKEADGEPTNNSANKGKQVEGSDVYTWVESLHTFQKNHGRVMWRTEIADRKRGSNEEG